MGLSNSRIHPGGETLFSWERAALDYVLHDKDIHDVDPYQAWPLQEFTDPVTGRLYEVDLLFLGRHALYLIEIKSDPGILTGDARDWYFRDPKTGHTRTLANPYPQMNHRAKVLKSLLSRELKDELRIRVEALTFISHPEVQNRLAPYGNERVVGRDQIARALTHGTHLDDYLRNFVVNRPTMKAVVAALHKLGLRPSKTARLVGEYQLGSLLDEDEAYQEHEGRHRSIEGRAVRIRSYLVPRATTVERQQQLRRAARREAEILTGLGKHPAILECRDYVDSAPLGPALLFERFEDGVPLDEFLRRRKEQGRELNFDERLGILQQVAEALGHCHGNNVLHRNLEPHSVLVHEAPSRALEVRLHRFHLAMHEETSSGTAHLTELQGAASRVYCAPEVLEDASKASVESDVFSLGALAYFILSGQPPAADLVEHQRRLDKDDGFLLSAVRDDFSADVVDAIRMATNPRTASRADSAIEWFHILMEQATRPPPEATPRSLDPYDAHKGDKLDGDLTVLRVLGAGSTARVLEVQDAKERLFALKVPHDERQMERLRAEAAVLAGLRHAHIVQSHGMRRIGGRDCLLLDFAAERTLAGLLREEGTVNLDYARRYGEDLLNALQYLEEQQVQHRDIKPSNIGFTPSDKQARHLILFDFSLSQVDPTAITTGTAVYRDPFLRRRGRWDPAADRYAAAVTMYQMLTGTLPEVGDEGDERAVRAVRMDAERFDASARDHLIPFFERAFDADADRRFPSAEAMRHAWVSLFGPVSATAAPAHSAATPVTEAPAQDVPTRPLLDSVTLDTPVEGLPLSSRARNALDRAGVIRVRELLQLPRNHLSAVRGVGRKVAKEIQATAAELRERLSTDVGGVEPFAPDYRGPRVALRIGGGLGLDPATYYKLHDAGIGTTAELAGTPRTRIEHCLGAAAAGPLRERLMGLTAADGARTLRDWVTELLGPRGRKPTKPELQVRAFLGLEPERVPAAAGAGLPSAADVARALGVERSTVLRNVKEQRLERWRTCESLPALVEACTAAVAAQGGVCPAEDAVKALVLGHRAPGVADDESNRHARALLRLVTELEDPERVLALGRVRGEPWLALEANALPGLERLGDRADALATRSPLPSSETVRRELEEVVAGTPLAALALDRLAQVAVRASQRAAVSSRLELYPRGLSAERVLALCASSVLAVPAILPSELRSRVRARYPEAEPLPLRPALDALVETHGFLFVAEGDEGLYRRKGSEAPSTTFTVAMLSQYSPASSSEPMRSTPGALEGRAFQEAMSGALARGRFRVLKVPFERYEEGTQELAKAFRFQVSSLDHRLWEEIRRLCERDGVALETVLATDRAGSASPDWHLLRALVEEAAQLVVDDWLRDRSRPRLVRHLGTLARFQLDGPLHALAERAEHEEGAAIFLLVPGYKDGRPPSINDAMPVPAPLPGQWLPVPVPWLRGEHLARVEPAELDDPSQPGSLPKAVT